jgi:hypothetical protein
MVVPCRRHGDRSGPRMRASLTLGPLAERGESLSPAQAQAACPRAAGPGAGARLPKEARASIEARASANFAGVRE